MEPVSIIFATYNRSELLYKALKAVQVQSVPVDIIVMHDASTDDTEFMIKRHFPKVNYQRSEKNYGPAFQRNEGAKLASSEIIFFLDDDTILNDLSIINTITHDFTDYNVGSVTIPFINILQDKIVNTASPNNACDYVYHSFIAAAFAVRRKIFMELNGFRPEYFYMGEEGDFCLRLLEAGYVVKAGTSKPAVHYQPANRVSYSADFYGRRNDILFLYLNAPILNLPFAIIYTIIRGLVYGIKVRRIKFAFQGLNAGLRLLLDEKIRNLRKPVNSKIFAKFRYLKRHEPLALKYFAKI